MTDDWLPFAVPDIGEEEIAEVVDTLRSGWITTGPKAVAFEKEFATRVGATHAIAVNSCTAALHLALEAIGISPGDEVACPTLTFAATAEVVRYLGAKPVLVDVRRDDHQIDADDLARRITARTRAVIPVHFAGQACDLDRVIEVARSSGARVIEDAAHAFPLTYRGRSVGSISDITCFSFYATKTITTGEGGMATTEREDWAERMRIMSLHGISRDAWKRYSAQGSWRYDIIAPGYKYNLTDVAAAMGRVQLRRADEMRTKRASIAEAYSRAFEGLQALEPLARREDGNHAWHLYVVRLRDGALMIDRDELVEQLKAKGIGTSVHFIPLHLHSYYKTLAGYEAEDFPVAYDVYRRSVSLPIYSRMTERDVSRVIDAVSNICRANAR